MTSIRASILPDYLDCPRRAAARCWRSVIAEAGFTLPARKANIFSAIGTGTHTATTYQLQSKIDTGSLPAIDDSFAAGVASFRDEIMDGIDYDDTAPNQNAAEKQLIAMARLYYHRVAPRLHPLAVERPMKARYKITGVTSGKTCLGSGPIADDYIEIRGRLDVETLVTESARGIRDTKTGMRPRHNHAQLGCYSLLAKSAPIDDSRPIRFLDIDFLKRGRATKPPEYEQIKYRMADCEAMAYQTIKAVADDLERFAQHGDPNVWRMNPSSMLCSAKYCSAYASDWCFIGR